MDRFIKNVPLMAMLCLIPTIWLTYDKQYSNAFIAALSALVIFIITAGVYIIRVLQGKIMITAKSYVLVMLGAGLFTFIILYTGLQYFYT